LLYSTSGETVFVIFFATALEGVLPFAARDFPGFVATTGSFGGFERGLEQLKTKALTIKIFVGDDEQNIRMKNSPLHHEAKRC
jgi:hypothetical protein